MITIHELLNDYQLFTRIIDITYYYLYNWNCVCCYIKISELFFHIQTKLTVNRMKILVFITLWGYNLF